MKGTWANVSVAHTWLHTMGDAASDLNLTIQYCLPEPRHIVASTAIRAVTQSRCSPDYHPNETPPQGSWPNYQVQLSSLLLSAVGIQPFKDVFWSTETQVRTGDGGRSTRGPRRVTVCCAVCVCVRPVRSADARLRRPPTLPPARPCSRETPSARARASRTR